MGSTARIAPVECSSAAPTPILHSGCRKELPNLDVIWTRRALSCRYQHDASEMSGPHRVLITAGGFIGSHVAELLLRVHALARYNGRGDIGHLRHLPQSLSASLQVRLGGIADLTR
jgi:hypothetical protein